MRNRLIVLILSATLAGCGSGGADDRITTTRMDSIDIPPGTITDDLVVLDTRDGAQSLPLPVPSGPAASGGQTAPAGDAASAGTAAGEPGAASSDPPSGSTAPAPTATPSSTEDDT